MRVCRLLWLCGLTVLLSAHPVSFMTVDLRQDGDDLILRIVGNLEDVVAFQEVLPTAGGSYGAAELRRALQRHQQWLAERIRVLDGDGQAVPVTIAARSGAASLVEDQGFTSLADQPFSLDLRLSGGASVGTAATIHYDLGAVRRGIAASLALRYPAQPDWPDRIIAEGMAFPLWPDEQERQATADEVLALPHPAVRQSFAYCSLTPRRLTQELLLPYLALEQQVGIERPDPGRLTAADRQLARQRLASVVPYLCRVSSDGEERDLVVEAIDFLSVDGGEVVATDAVLVPHLTRLGVRLACPVERPPERIGVRWQTFVSTIDRVRQQVVIGDLREGVFLTPDRASAEWPVSLASGVEVTPVVGPRALRPLAVYLLGLAILLGLAGVGGLAGRAGRWCGVGLLAVAIVAGGRLARPTAPPGLPDLVAALQTDSYRALAQGSDAAIYDRLGLSTAEPLRSRIFAEMVGDPRISDAAQVLVEDVAVEALGEPVRTAAGWALPCRWTVRARILHWGHSHQRRNRYAGLVTVARQPVGWRLIDARIRAVERVDDP